MWAINTINLVKKVKDLTAVDGVNLEIAERECFGFNRLILFIFQHVISCLPFVLSFNES